MDFETLRMLFLRQFSGSKKKKKKKKKNWEDFCMYLMISNVNAVCYEWVV